MFSFTQGSALSSNGILSSPEGALDDSMLQFASTASRREFRPAPLEPTWILEGNPVARSLPLAASQDGQFSCGQWDCTAGRFQFIYYCDEIVHILEGEVTVEGDGKKQTLRPGDVALFQQGLVTYWTVPNYVRKFAIFRSKHRSLLRRIGSKIKRIGVSALGL